MATASTTTTGSSPLVLGDEGFVLTARDVVVVLGLECDVCNELFDLEVRQPKLLTCNHTVCLPCLQKIMASRTRAYDNTIACPTCRGETYCDSLEELSSDFRVVKGLDAISKAKVLFKNVCFEHNCQKLEQFCKLCVMPVCSDCIRLNHDVGEGHVIIGSTQALEENQGRFDVLETKCTESLRLMNIRNDLIENNIKAHLDRKESNQIKAINDRFDDYSKLLLERKEGLITQVREKVKQRKTDMSSESASLVESMKQLRKLYDNFRTSRESTDVRDIFKIQKKFIDNENDLLAVSPNEDLCESYEFKAVNEERFKSDMSAIGDVNTSRDVTMLSPV